MLRSARVQTVAVKMTSVIIIIIIIVVSILSLRFSVNNVSHLE